MKELRGEMIDRQQNDRYLRASLPIAGKGTVFLLMIVVIQIDKLENVHSIVSRERGGREFELLRSLKQRICRSEQFLVNTSNFEPKMLFFFFFDYVCR